jgi:hypothetical protein
MENQFWFSKHFFLENKTRKSKVVKLHLISGEPVAIIKIAYSKKKSSKKY